MSLSDLGDLVEGLSVPLHLSQFHARDIGRNDCLDVGWKISSRIFSSGDGGFDP